MPRYNEDKAFKVALLANDYAWYVAGGPDHVPRSQIDAQKVLTIPAVIFDTIGWVGPPFKDQNLGFNVEKWEDYYRNKRVSFVDSLWHDLQSSWEGPIEELEHIFSVTLVREYPANKRGISARHRHMFLAYRNTMAKALGPSHSNPYDTPEFAGFAENSKFAFDKLIIAHC